MRGSRAERGSRFSIDIDLHATNAAHAAQPLRTLINELQAKTLGPLSYETRRYAENKYERELFKVVRFSLETIIRILSSSQTFIREFEYNATVLDDKFWSEWREADDDIATTIDLTPNTQNQQFRRLIDLWDEKGQNKDESKLKRTYFQEYLKALLFDTSRVEADRILSLINALIETEYPNVSSSGIGENRYSPQPSRSLVYPKRTRDGFEIELRLRYNHWTSFWLYECMIAHKTEDTVHNFVEKNLYENINPKTLLSVIIRLDDPFDQWIEMYKRRTKSKFHHIPFNNEYSTAIMAALWTEFPNDMAIIRAKRTVDFDELSKVATVACLSEDVRDVILSRRPSEWSKLFRKADFSNKSLDTPAGKMKVNLFASTPLMKMMKEDINNMGLSITNNLTWPERFDDKSAEIALKEMSLLKGSHIIEDDHRSAFAACILNYSNTKIFVEVAQRDAEVVIVTAAMIYILSHLRSDASHAYIDVVMQSTQSARQFVDKYNKVFGDNGITIAHNISNSQDVYDRNIVVGTFDSFEIHRTILHLTGKTQFTNLMNRNQSAILLSNSLNILCGGLDKRRSIINEEIEIDDLLIYIYKLSKDGRRCRMMNDVKNAMGIDRFDMNEVDRLCLPLSHINGSIREWCIRHLSQLITSAFIAESMQVGRDYELSFDVHGGEGLNLVVVLSNDHSRTLCLQQFLELRHGLSLSPLHIPILFSRPEVFIGSYSHVMGVIPASGYTLQEFRNEFINNDDRVVIRIDRPSIVHKKDHYNLSIDSWIKEIKEKIEQSNQMYKEGDAIVTLIICPTRDILYKLRDSLGSSTPLVNSEEELRSLRSSFNIKNCVVLTTKTSFMRWNNNTYHDPLSIIIGIDYSDCFLLEKKSFTFARPVGSIQYCQLYQMNYRGNQWIGLACRTVITNCREEREKIVREQNGIEDIIMTSLHKTLHDIRKIGMDSAIIDLVQQAYLHEFALWRDSHSEMEYLVSREMNCNIREEMNKLNSERPYNDVLELCQWIRSTPQCVSICSVLLTHKLFHLSQFFLQTKEPIDIGSSPEILYYRGVHLMNEKNYDSSRTSLLHAKGGFYERLLRTQQNIQLVHIVRDANGTPPDIRVDSFVEQQMLKMIGIKCILVNIDELLEMFPQGLPNHPSEIIVKKVADRFSYPADKLSFSLRSNTKEIEFIGTSADDFCMILFNKGVCLDKRSLIALGEETIGKAASYLPYLKNVHFPEEERNKYLQESDRNLKGCRFYEIINNEFETITKRWEFAAELLQLPGATQENFFLLDIEKIKAFRFSEAEFNKKAGHYNRIVHSLLIPLLSGLRPIIAIPRNPASAFHKELIDSGLKPNDNHRVGRMIMCDGMSWCKGAFHLKSNVCPKLMLNVAVRQRFEEEFCRCDSLFDGQLMTPAYRPDGNHDIPDSSSWIMAMTKGFGSLNHAEWLHDKFNVKYYANILQYYDMAVKERDAVMANQRLVKLVHDGFLQEQDDDSLARESFNDKNEMKLIRMQNEMFNTLNRNIRIVSVKIPPVESHVQARILGNYIRRRRVELK